jgi:carboxyvinyl-carboxyphosphonate phosphorylmutase
MPSRWSSRRTRFRGILAGRACVHPASVHDAVSARIAADLDFELGMFAGSVASLAVLGAPDLIVLTLSEFADQAYRIGRSKHGFVLCGPKVVVTLITRKLSDRIPG